jgi:iron complex outermembrane receptor protein
VGLGLWCSASYAQQLSISGAVHDAHGVVPSATVTLQAASGSKTEATTDDAGQYHFDGLSAGLYQLEFRREGFAPSAETLSLAAESRTVDVTLTVAGAATSIDVIDVAGKSTGTRMEISDREIPSQITVVSQTTLREQGVSDLAAALENASGVITQVQYGVYEWYTIGGVTQQSGNDFLFVDGMTLTGNRSNTLINNIEEVQVFNGPNAALYGGAGASQGGMVNVIRKKPQAHCVQELMYRAGPWGLQQVGGASAGSIFGLTRLLYRVDTAYAHADGWRDSGSNRFNFSPSIAWLITDRLRITANQTFVRDRYTLDGGVLTRLLNQPGFPVDRKLNPPGDFQLTREWQNLIVFNANITNRLSFRNSFYKGRKRDQYLDAETMSYVPATNVVNRTELYFQHNRRPTQNQSDFIGDYTFWGLRHRFLVGYDYQEQYNFSNRTDDAPGTSNSNGIPLPPVVLADWLKPGYVDPAPIYTNFPRTRVDYSANAVNAFAWQDQIDITRRLKINVAGRYDDYKRRTHNDTYANDVFVSRGPEAGQRHQTHYSYRAGAVYEVTRNQWVYFGASSTFSTGIYDSGGSKRIGTNYFDWL